MKNFLLNILILLTSSNMWATTFSREELITLSCEKLPIIEDFVEYNYFEAHSINYDLHNLAGQKACLIFKKLLIANTPLLVLECNLLSADYIVSNDHMTCSYHGTDNFYCSHFRSRSTGFDIATDFSNSCDAGSVVGVRPKLPLLQ